MRPDRDKAPEAFGAWLKAVTKPSRFVAPRLVPHPEITHSPGVTSGSGTSWNWSGLQLRDSAYTYDYVMGEWFVPTVSYETDQHVYSSFWIGLSDDNGNKDLVQAGTEQEITDIPIYVWGAGLIHYYVTTYYAWTEFLPLQPTMQVIPNFTVTPGDQILTQVWIGDPGTPPSLSGFFGVFSVENVSRSEHTIIYTQRIWPWIDVGGSEAEWIMERPCLNNCSVLPDLANYGITYMYSPIAHVANTQFSVSYDSASYNQIFMYNGPNTTWGPATQNDLLSGAYPAVVPTALGPLAGNSPAIEFIWYNFH